ncbi:MAG: hypothetical protein ABJA61_00620 [Caldimonas sp.]
MPCESRPASLLAAAIVVGAAALAGCTAPGLLLTATGVATDTSMTWDIVKHLHAKLVEDSPPPCLLLNSVQRAVTPRCDFVAGSIRTADLAKNGLQECPLAAATRDPRLWRALPELIDKGATVQGCPGSPLEELAAAEPCPDFSTASPAVLKSLTFLAESDPRAVRHDIFRMLSCPRARAVGLDAILVRWLDSGKLEPGTLSFSPLSALHPDMLVTRFGHELEIAGHKPQLALDNYDGSLPTGFEEALRTSNWAALEWWLYRLPRLASQAPPTRGGVLPWLPLYRVLLPGFLLYPGSQGDVVGFLIAHGADPRAKLPFDPDRTVITFAASIKSPMLALLDPPAVPLAAPTTFAKRTAQEATPR